MAPRATTTRLLLRQLPVSLKSLLRTTVICLHASLTVKSEQPHRRQFKFVMAVREFYY